MWEPGDSNPTQRPALCGAAQAGRGGQLHQCIDLLVLILAPMGWSLILRHPWRKGRKYDTGFLVSHGMVFIGSGSNHEAILADRRATFSHPHHQAEINGGTQRNPPRLLS